MASVNALSNEAAHAPGTHESAAGSGGPDHTVLLGLVARRHYVEGCSKVEIAAEVGLSRFKVARLLDEARERGIVRIEVVEDPEIDVDRSIRLRAELGLAHVLALTPDSGGLAGLDRLGDTAARFVAELLEEHDVLGLPWSRTVHAMVRRLRSLPPIPVVQLCGAQPPPGDDSSAVEVVVDAARLAGTRGHVFFTPLLVTDAATAAALRQEPQVARALERASTVTTAVVGVGAWGPGTSTVHDACTQADRADLTARGVVGEIAGVAFDASGAVVASPVADRLIAVDASALSAIPRVVALARGAQRARAVRAAARGGLITGLVADAELAEALLTGRD